MVNPMDAWQGQETPESMEQSRQIPEQELLEAPEMQGEEIEAQEPSWESNETPATYQGEVEPTADEPWFDYILRNATATTARLTEQFVGAPGNLQNFIAEMIKTHPKYFGIVGSALHELVGDDRWNQFWDDYQENQTLPTSEKIKDFVVKHTGEYTLPKTKGEERYQNLIEDVGSTLLVRRPASLGKKVMNTFAIPAAANVAKNMAEDIGFKEDKSNLAKLGVWMSLSLAGNVNAPKYASQLMNKGRQGIPNTLNIDVARYQKRLQTAANNPMLLHADPRSDFARQEISALEKDLANGQTSVRSLMTSYDGVNALKRKKGLFELNAEDRKFAIKAINNVRDAVKEEILESAKQHPEALKQWQAGLGAWASIHKSRAITNYVDSLAKGPYAKLIQGPAGALFGLGAFSAYKAPQLTSMGMAVAPAAYKIGQTAFRVWDNPVLANYYWKAIGGAMAEDLPAFVTNYTKLNKELKKEEKK